MIEENLNIPEDEHNKYINRRNNYKKSIGMVNPLGEIERIKQRDNIYSEKKPLNLIHMRENYEKYLENTEFIKQVE